MDLIIRSKKLGKTFEFWAPDAGGYIRLVSDNRPGNLGQQICEGGGCSGHTLSCGPSTKSFERICRNWYRAHIRDKSKEDFE